MERGEPDVGIHGKRACAAAAERGGTGCRRRNGQKELVDRDIDRIFTGTDLLYMRGVLNDQRASV